MAAVSYFDLESAKKALRWMIPKITKVKELSMKGEKAMNNYDLDSADEYTQEIHRIFEIIQKKGIIIRDKEATLFDFPAVINNIPAYLCWSIDEDDLEYWHYADQGFEGRSRITGKEDILSYL